MVTGISLEQAVELMTGGLSPLESETLPALQALANTPRAAASSRVPAGSSRLPVR